jgi:hypothetical protein
MRNSVLHRIGRFFEGAGHVISTPSGDARGHLYRKDFMESDLTGMDVPRR